MKFAISLPTGLSAIWLLTCISIIQAHSWVEQLSLIASNGTFVGTPGYPRGFIQRGTPTFSDFNLEWQVPPNGRATAYEILPTDLMCRKSQHIGNQTEGFPALTAAPGDQIALIYQENGHVTQLINSPTKPVGSGTIYIYGTKQPANTDTYLGIHRVWNTAGTGGDQRGKLLATRHFDDGQCFQNSTKFVELEWARRKEFNPIANDLKCQSDLQLPTDAGTSGQYTLYWVWEWPTLNNVTGATISNESYTTCMDINMKPAQLPSLGGFKTVQPVDFRAIEEQLSTAFIVNPTIEEQLTSTPGGALATSIRLSPGTTIPGSSSALPTSSAQPVQSATSTSKAVGGFITVTVTQAAQTKTITETVEVPMVSAAQPSRQSSQQAVTRVSERTQLSTATVVPLPSINPSASSTKKSAAAASPSQLSSTSSVAYTPSAVPAIQPFLASSSASKVVPTPQTQIAKAPAQASSLSKSGSPLAPSAAATSDNCPDMTPEATSTPTASTTRHLAPNQSAVTYLNGSLHHREFKLRGRIIIRS